MSPLLFRLALCFDPSRVAVGRIGKMGHDDLRLVVGMQRVKPQFQPFPTRRGTLNPQAKFFFAQLFAFPSIVTLGRTVDLNAGSESLVQKRFSDLLGLFPKRHRRPTDHKFRAQ